MAGSIVVHGGCVVTMDERRRRFDDGFVLVRDGVIEAVGPAAEMPGAGAVDTRLDARGCVVTPGLVNTHQHHWYDLFKTLGGGMLLEQWIQNLLVPTARAMTPGDLEAAARLAALEMIGTGTTTVLNHSVTETREEEAEATLRPLLEAGMRQVFAKEVRPEPLEDQLALARAVHDRWHGAGDGLARVALVIETTAHWVALGTCSEQLVLRGHELAAELDAKISTHVAGGTMARDQGYLKFVLEMGRTDIDFLQQLGVLDERWLLAHAIHLRDSDVELVAASGATVSHTPTSESARGAGITPVRRYRDAGIVVGLGTDGPMVDTSVDMLEQAKVAMLLQNQLHTDPRALAPEDALAMATIEAARTLGLEAEIGSLEPGKRADIAAFDLDNPRCAPAHDPVAALVQSARGADARHVVVDGEPLLRDAAFVRHDADAVREIVAEARARAAELLERTEVPAHRQAAGRDTLPAIV